MRRPGHPAPSFNCLLYVLPGQGGISLDDVETDDQPGDSFDVPRGMRHGFILRRRFGRSFRLAFQPEIQRSMLRSLANPLLAFEGVALDECVYELTDGEFPGFRGPDDLVGEVFVRETEGTS